MVEMEFKTDIMNIPQNRYVIIKNNCTPIISSLKPEEGYFLAKVINIRSITLVGYTNDLFVVCSIFGIEEKSMHDIFTRKGYSSGVTTLRTTTNNEFAPVIKKIKLSSIISYHVITPEEYPLLVGYYWLDDMFKEEAFGVLI